MLIDECPANDGKWVSLADPEGNEFDLVVG
jgi:hypothetical protein